MRKQRVISGAEYGRLVAAVEEVRDAVRRDCREHRSPGRLVGWRSMARDAVALRMMGEAGLRVGELCRLTWADLLVAEGPVQVLTVSKRVGKGGREREVPLTEGVRDALLGLYAADVACTGVGGVGRGLCMTEPVMLCTARQIERRVERLSELTLGRKIHPHCLRHLCGNRWRRVSGDPYVVQKLLGHARLETTVRYTRVDGGELRSAVEDAAKLGD